MELEDLVLKAQSGNRECEKIILEKLTPLIKSKARRVYIKNYEREDLVQVGYLSLLKSIKNYDSTEGNFLPYAYSSIKNSYSSIIRDKINTQYEESLYKETFENIPLIDTLKDPTDIEENYIKKDLTYHLKNALKKLSKDELEIIWWIYYKQKPLKHYLVSSNKSYYQCRYIRDRALKKLKKYLVVYKR